MAHEFYGVNKGQRENDVVIQSSSPTKDVELNVNLASNLSRLDVEILVKEILANIAKKIWPPA